MRDQVSVKWEARVVVAKDPHSGNVKCASAHDMRRSFGTRWAEQVMPAVLQRLMRHASIGTTMRYYVGIEADDLAADLAANHRASDEAQNLDSTLDNSTPSDNSIGPKGVASTESPQASSDKRLAE